MLARESLLAERLRTGRHLSFATTNGVNVRPFQVHGYCRWKENFFHAV